MPGHRLLLLVWPNCEVVITLLIVCVVPALICLSFVVSLSMLLLADMYGMQLYVDAALLAYKVLLDIEAGAKP